MVFVSSTGAGLYVSVYVGALFSALVFVSATGVGLYVSVLKVLSMVILIAPIFDVNLSYYGYAIFENNRKSW